MKYANNVSENNTSSKSSSGKTGTTMKKEFKGQKTMEYTQQKHEPTNKLEDQPKVCTSKKPNQIQRNIKTLTREICKAQHHQGKRNTQRDDPKTYRKTTRGKRQKEKAQV